MFVCFFKFQTVVNGLSNFIQLFELRQNIFTFFFSNQTRKY